MFIDMHSDTMFAITDKIEAQFSLSDACKIGGGVQIFACCTEPKNSKNPFETAKAAILNFKSIVENDDRIEIVYDLKSAPEIAKTGKVAAILALEGCDCLEGKIENLEKFYEMGVRIASLTWNGENALASGCGASGGLKAFGKEVLKFLERNHILTDVSHLNNETFWDVLKLANSPVIASHSCSYELCLHERNITEDMFRALLLTGGGIGINFYPLFLNGTLNASTDDLIRHFDYFLNLSAGRGVGIGSDFDGVDALPKGISGTKDLPFLADLLTQTFGKAQSDAVMYKNIEQILHAM